MKKVVWWCAVILFAASMVMGQEWLVEKVRVIDSVVPLQIVVVTVIIILIGAILLRKTIDWNGIIEKIGNFFLGCVYILTALAFLGFWILVIWFFYFRG